MPILPLFVAASAFVPSPSSSKINTLFDFSPGEIACNDGNPIAVSIERPIPSASVFPLGGTLYDVVFTFRIEHDGRVSGIQLQHSPAQGDFVPASDLQPALAASRFAAGAPKTQCLIRYRAKATWVGTVAPAVAQRFLTLPHDRVAFEREIIWRARDLGGTCFADGPPTRLLQGFPDLDKIPQPAGALSVSVAGFDIDRSGKPVRIRTLTSDGNQALDAELREAIAKSRYKADDPRTNCSFAYYRRQPIALAAPEAPPLNSYNKGEDGCPPEDSGWAYLPPLTFPEPFRRRGIEGWAVVRYDIAPWGQVANVNVVASEPAAAFGEQARQIIASARRKSSLRGATGCVERVRFKMGKREDAIKPAPPPAPIPF